MDYWYASQPLLSWTLSCYFFGDQHYVYLAAPFHPYRLANPPSSRPHEIYERLYEGAHDRDFYNDTIRARRDGLRAAISYRLGALDSLVALALHHIVDNVDPIFFTPIVYRVDRARISSTRIDLSAGTRAHGIASNECLVRDLRPGEFEILLLSDNAPNLAADPQIALIAMPILQPSLPKPRPAEILAALMIRCI